MATRLAGHVTTTTLDPRAAQAERDVLTTVSPNPALRNRFVDPATGVPYSPMSARCRSITTTAAEIAEFRCLISERANGRLITSKVIYPPLTQSEQAAAETESPPPLCLPPSRGAVDKLQNPEAGC